jgi:DNA-binding CsgD family transcriptional regulator
MISLARTSHPVQHVVQQQVQAKVTAFRSHLLDHSPGKDILSLLCPDWRGASLVIDGTSGKIVFANRRAMRLVEGASFVHVVSGKLAFMSADINRRYHAKLEQVMHTAADNVALITRNDAGTQWLSASFHALQGITRETLTYHLGGDYEVNNLVVIEFSASSDIPAPQSIAAFAEALLLTPAERQVVVALTQGRTLAEIAAMRGCSLCSVRQHVKSLLAKSQCTRQTELVNLVRAVCPTGNGLEN